jgi:hypothetical protein
MSGAYSVPREIGRFQMQMLLAGGVFLIALVIGAFFNPTQFFRSYLFAFLFWVGIPLGSLALLMLQHLTGGAWGLVIRRVLEAATRTIPLMLLLFAPIVLGAAQIYPWMHHVEMAKSPALEQKARLYLNLPFFTVRTLIYFAVWMLLAYLLNKWSLAQDRTDDRQFTGKMRVLSAPGLILFVLTVTFATVDWAMSLNPDWFSTIYGLLFVAAWALSALAFVIFVLAFLSAHGSMAKVVAPNHFKDLGKLMLAFVMLWTYFAFSQFLIIWSANLPEEIQWYLPRASGGWGVIAVLLVILHFAFPFLLLLSSSLKRNPRKLQLVAVLILGMRCLDTFWMIAPEFSNNFRVTWMDVVAALGIGGVWLAFFAWQLGQRALMPINDPQFDAVLNQTQVGH